ncbi:hypothetical protein TVAG_356050 [Trichomonas vaginalis G3]|uniref:Uncharacterized protein n=1 Tax=Trichomonas vaginalis (strain ATCC PRA-98 / G3) TaxID=412133 RepID=A2FK47_TRIV3|nr:hypothetical protein TVAGG3_0020420 [Trichomonas vaginalis G3]EAX94726.1 hypothetical protein TVAG_356050 [Trichomonas vaginalis G3]KAI5539637.1 hypothetical protein TVAGG3_0020420 [Trichomonas vaginalis G3]|eukprot:XP_001307656.1 hypothetical protein [Trichomonas vaginalis G3]
MVILVLFFGLAKCLKSSIQFQSLKLNFSDVTISIPNGYNLIFQPSDKIRIKITKDKQQKAFTVYKDQYMQVSRSNITFKAFKNSIVQMYYWLIPTTLCGRSSVHFSADKSIRFNSETTTPSSKICVFPQSNAYSHELYGSFTSNSTNCSLNFYAIEKMHLNVFQGFREMKAKLKQPVYSTPANNHYKLDFSSPYFMQYSNCGGSELKLQMSSKVERQSQKSADCGVYSIPSMNSMGGLMLNNQLGFVTIEKCSNKSEDVAISLFLVSGVFYIFSLFLICILFIPEKSSPLSKFRLSLA